MATLITHGEGSRLEQLCAQYDLAKAEAAKAEEALKAITDGIKAELSMAMPQGETTVIIRSPHLMKPLKLQARESWRIDAKKLKTEDPATYVRYAVKGTSWVLAPVKS